MKSSQLAAVVVSVLSLAAYTTARADHHEGEKKDAAHHSEHAKHKHKHKKNCGHKAEKHGDHEDYEHDGHHHKGHAGHVDECSGPEAEAAPAAQKQ